ncbi:hypothetical protein [Geobacter sp.]|uniref:hypothetical protein n=1 Tax=Geobacter sp. TaxID=46610 RepID=UPI002608EAC0|nr:hypothetical protein [Geobacter sp.]
MLPSKLYKSVVFLNQNIREYYEQEGYSTDEMDLEGVGTTYYTTLVFKLWDRKKLESINKTNSILLYIAGAHEFLEYDRGEGGDFYKFNTLSCKREFVHSSTFGVKYYESKMHPNIDGLLRYNKQHYPFSLVVKEDGSPDSLLLSGMNEERLCDFE